MHTSTLGWIDEGAWQEMLTVDMIGRVRREHAHGKSIRKISAELRLSRATVAKYLKSGETEGRYQRSRQPYPQLGPYIAELERLLEDNERRGKRDRLNRLQIFGALQQAGYSGGYDAVRRYANHWSSSRSALSATAAFIPLTFLPGEAYQFDWAEEWIILDGVTTKVQVAHFRLCHSRMPYVRVYLRQAQEMVFDAHARAFAFWGGTCERGIYDNMKTAVDAVFVGKARTFNRRFQQMCSHYLVEPTACSPAAGWEKGQVENQVGSLRRRLFTPRLKVKTLDELNRWLEDECMAYARTARHPEFSDKTVWQVFEAERPALVPVGQPFDGFRESDVGVSKTCLIRFDRNRYSVEARAAAGSVQLRVYADKIVARLDGEVVAEHPRAFGRDRTVYDPLHYIPVLARKPGALRNGAPFREWRMPPGLTRVRACLGRGDDADRQFVGILAAIPENGLDAVEAACLQSLQEGLHSRDAVLNILSRSKDAGAPAPLTAMNAPALRHEPVADCARYDRLRDQEMTRGAA